MARNFFGPGDRVSLAAPYALASGQGALVGGIFGVAQGAGASVAVVSLALAGVWDLTKEPGLAIGLGARVFWDNGNRRITTTAAGNTHVGYATAAAAGAAADVRVLLQRGTPAGT